MTWRGGLFAPSANRRDYVGTYVEEIVADFVESWHERGERVSRVFGKSVLWPIRKRGDGGP